MACERPHTGIEALYLFIYFNNLNWYAIGGRLDVLDACTNFYIMGKNSKFIWEHNVLQASCLFCGYKSNHTARN